MNRRSWRTKLRRHDLVGFYLVAVALTWAVWVPRALGVPVGVIGLVSTWIPAVAAVGWAALLHGRPGLADLGRRIVRWRIRWWWYPVVLLGPLLFALLTAAVAVLLGQSWSDVRPDALTLPIPALLGLLLVLAATDGLGEEAAWRGYLLPRMLPRYRAVGASLLLGVVWWLWHLPLIWTDGATLEETPPWLLLVDLLTKSVVFTAVFLHTRGSVLVAILLHASMNLFTVSPRPGPDGDLTLPLIALALQLLLALALVVHLQRISHHPAGDVYVAAGQNDQPYISSSAAAGEGRGR